MLNPTDLNAKALKKARTVACKTIFTLNALVSKPNEFLNVFPRILVPSALSSLEDMLDLSVSR